MDFSDCTFVVTAANSSIGESVTTGLLNRGARVIASIRKDRRLLIANKRLVVLEADLLIQDDCTAIAELAADLGGLKGLVHVAGAWIPGDITEIDGDIFDHAFAANVKSTFNICRALLPVLKKQGRSSIVTIASMLGISPIPKSIAYSTAKAALIQFSRALALDLGPLGIRCNCICPGLVSTRQTANVFSQQDWVQKIVRSYPLGRLGQPADVSELVAFLLSDEAGWITGCAIPIEGGYLISAEGG